MKQRMKGIAPSLFTALGVLGMLSGCAVNQTMSTRGDVPSTTSTASTASPHNTAMPAVSSPSGTGSDEFKFATADGPAQKVPVPVLPELAYVFSPEGLEAFAGYWFETQTHLFATGDSGPTLAIASPACVLCADTAREISRGYRGGNWIVGGQFSIYGTGTKFEEQPDGSYWASVGLQQTKRTYYNSDGSVAKDEAQESRYSSYVAAIYQNGRWWVNAVYLSGEEPKPLVYTEK